MREVLATIGLLFQAGGTLMIAIPIWRGPGGARYFDTTPGTLLDEHGRWPAFIRCGLALYMLGYIPIALSIWWPK